MTYHSGHSGKGCYGYKSYKSHSGYNKYGYDCDGYNKSGYDCNGYDKKGYDCNGYNKSGYDCNGYDKKGYDCDGYDKSGRDCDGYDKSGYDCDGYDKKGRDCDGYDKSGYDCDGYDRDGKDCDGNPKDDCGCDGDGGGDACEDTVVTLLFEDFEGGYCVPADADGVVSDDNWKVKNGAAYADGCKDGELVFASVDADAYDSVTISFDLKVINGCNWEASGSYADEVVVEVLVDGAWVMLDTFVIDGDELVGSETGQVVGSSFTNVSYTLTDVSDDMQLRVTADMSASDEKLKLDNVLITGTLAGECDPTPCGEEVRTSLLLETFDGSCITPDASDNVTSDGGWQVYYDSAYTDGCKDGELVFATVDASACDSVEISFDMAVGDICKWESEGCYADDVTVEVLIDGTWVLLDTFVRDGDVLVGSETGQTVANGAWSDVTYVLEDGSADLTLKITSDISASDEYLWLDNVEITCVTFEPCVELGSLGDYVWIDANIDGVQDADEVGVEGVTAELFLDGVSTGRTTTTDADGFYLFDDLEAGDYHVVFSTIPDNYAFTLPNTSGDEATDSDVADVSIDGTVGATDVFTLGEGEHLRDVDAGIYDLGSVVVLGSLGDYIWYDLDRDGVQDAGEGGVEGVTVELLKDGVLTGDVVVTGADGLYLFDELEAGNYAVQVSGIPAGYSFTIADQGGDNLADSDVDASGLSETYALGEGEDYMGLDAGIVVDLPTTTNDEFKICWNAVATVDVLSNDDAGLTITEVDGQAISEGASVTLASGAIVTLDGGVLLYDGIDAFDSLEFGTMGMDQFTYTAVNAFGGEATATVDATICANNIKTLEDITLLIPDVVEFTIDELGGTDGFLVDVEVPDTGDAEVDMSNARFELTGSSDVFCIDLAGEVLDDVTLNANLFLADEDDASLAAYVTNVENLDLVTYILNNTDTYINDNGFSVLDIQNAIWNLTDDFFILFDPNASAIVADAQANGEGYEAGEGDLVGLVIAPIQDTDPDTGLETNYQNFIYGVEYQTFSECLC